MAFHDVLNTVLEIYPSVFSGILFAWYAACLLKGRFRGVPFVMACGYAASRWVLSRILTAEEPDNMYTPVRTLLLLGISILLCALCCQLRMRLIVYVCISWQAVFVLAFFISYTVVLTAGPVYDHMAAAFVREAQSDPDGYLRRILAVAHFFNVLMSALLTLLCIAAVRDIVRNFPKTRADLPLPAFRLILLPAVTGFLLWLLLSPIIITVSDGRPQLLYDLYPPFVVIVPGTALVAGFSIVQAVRTCREMMALEEERSGRMVAEAQLNALRDLMQDSERMNAHVGRMRHDLKNTLTVIQSLSAEIPEGEALSTYLTELNGEMEKIERPYHTGDPVADILLGTKAAELQAVCPDAEFDAQGLALEEIHGISSYDLGIILGNALDNAVRAVSGQQKGSRFIRLRSFRYGQFLGLVITNSLAEPVTALPNGLPESTRAGTDHGLGLYNIRTIASKYGGTMDWECADGLFTLSVLLTDMEN